MRRLVWRLPLFERGQPEFELVDPVAEDLELGLVGQPSLRGPAQPRRGLGAGGDQRERHQPLRPVRAVRQPGGDLPGPVPAAQGGAGSAGRGGRAFECHPVGAPEHILLGLIREDDGVAAQILKEHSDLTTIRSAVLDLLPTASAEAARGRRWQRRRGATDPSEAGTQAEEAVLNATPATDSTLGEAARLAGSQPVGSHHLMLAALADPGTAAARALAALGVDLDQAKDALRSADITGTSDEPPEQAGRRQMVVQVTGERLTIEATDPVIIQAGRAALDALGDQASPPGTIRGDLPACASLSSAWQAIHDSLRSIERRAAHSAQPPDGPGKPDKSGGQTA